MDYKLLKPRDALNKAFLKVKPTRSEMERFKIELTALLDGVDAAESEEFHKNLLTNFLKKTGYDPGYFINTKGRNDLVIHNGGSAKTPVGVILEVKSPANEGEMMRLDRINVKALQELLLYYLRERITGNNLEIRHLIVTNVYEWFIFDAQVFERCFARNKELVRVFSGFDDGRLAGTKTDYFYKEVAPHYIKAALSDLSFTHIDLRTVEKELRDADKENDAKLIPLLKVFSPEHLLKLPFTNDSNTLDKRFYTELLHIIGLTERKEGGKKLIGRKPEGERDAGSLLENAIGQIESLGKIERLEHPQAFGADANERLFNVALELAITWTNRVLFLKLLEAHLLACHKGDRRHAFLNKEKVRNFDDLNSLFFEVLARTPKERSAEMNSRFGNVPYLNSSLFEPSAIEHAGLFISQIKDRKLPVHPATVLKDRHGKKRTGDLDALDYFFEFLDAYDFSADGAEEIQEECKTLINASVLGLIFEKINGYKDGSFFTPGFITMYMCRETIRRAVVQKFNQEKGWNCETIGQVADRIEDNADANRIINSLRICDPAAGSGHFLVSALNELIALKSELGVLCDRAGRRLKNIHVEVVNDELFVTDEDGEFFEYKPKLPESQRVQEALFHEKQTLIENCLFGVDINPNSVKICRLRLWIELLKNAYYKAEGELETLPNIDINIKCGNSLISRFALDADLKKALKKGKWTIDAYRLAVMSYRNAETKEQKRAMEKLIGEIKSGFQADIYTGDTDRLSKARKALAEYAGHPQLFALSREEKAKWKQKVAKLAGEVEKAERKIEEIKSNRMYENAFEWRFEFPEVLGDDGTFIGFDAVIGNPPYGVEFMDDQKELMKARFDHIVERIGNSFLYFMGISFELVKPGGITSFILPNEFLFQIYMTKARRFFLDNARFAFAINVGEDVFDAVVPTCIVSLQKQQADSYEIPIADLRGCTVDELPARLNTAVFQRTTKENIRSAPNSIFSFNVKSGVLVNRLSSQFAPFENFCDDVANGISTSCDAVYIVPSEKAAQEQFEEPFCKPCIRGGQLNRYFCPRETGDRLLYVTSEFDATKGEQILEYLSEHKSLLIRKSVEKKAGKRDWHILFRPRYEELFRTPKILLRQTGDSIIAAVDDQAGFYCIDSVNVALVKTQFASKIWYLTGLLNSRLLNFFYREISQEAGRILAQVKPQRIRVLPIAQATPKGEEAITKLVVQIASTKQGNPDADVSALEAEIDRLVYALYGLTDEEVQMVEGLGGAGAPREGRCPNGGSRPRTL